MGENSQRSYIPSSESHSQEGQIWHLFTISLPGMMPGVGGCQNVFKESTGWGHLNSPAPVLGGDSCSIDQSSPKCGPRAGIGSGIICYCNELRTETENKCSEIVITIWHCCDIKHAILLCLMKLLDSSGLESIHTTEWKQNPKSQIWPFHHLWCEESWCRAYSSSLSVIHGSPVPLSSLQSWEQNLPGKMTASASWVKIATCCSLTALSGQFLAHCFLLNKA